MSTQMLTKKEVRQQFKEKLDYSEVLQYLISDIFKFFRMDCKTNQTKDCDIEILTKDNNIFRIELKQEKKTKYTGNIAIEYESWEKPSGIAATKANLWVHFFLDKHDMWWFVIFDVNEMRKEIGNVYSFKTSGGDNNKSMMYILSIEKIKTMKSVIMFGCVPSLVNVLGN